MADLYFCSAAGALHGLDFVILFAGSKLQFHWLY